MQNGHVLKANFAAMIAYFMKIFVSFPQKNVKETMGMILLGRMAI